MKKLALILALTAAMPAYAGGPVIIEDEYDVTEPAPRRDWIVPVIIGGIILCAIACGSDSDEPAPVDPGPVCFKEGC